MKQQSVMFFLAAALAILLAACGQKEAVVSDLPASAAFHSSDECHVCGMVITRFPGPKGQAFNKNNVVAKFCSVAEMLSWWLQPDNQRQTQVLYVHDMSNSNWDAPDDAHMINARQAFYVLAPQLRGAMGVTLAAFGSQEAAVQLAAQNGTEVMDFEQVSDFLAREEGHSGDTLPHGKPHGTHDGPHGAHQ